MAKKRVNFYFSSCSTELTFFSPGVIPFWKESLKENRVPSFIFSKSRSIFSYFHGLSSSQLSLTILRFLSSASFAYSSVFRLSAHRSFPHPHLGLSIILFRPIGSEAGCNRTNAPLAPIDRSFKIPRLITILPEYISRLKKKNNHAMKALSALTRCDSNRKLRK